MGLGIQTIENGKLRAAAEAADSQGSKAYNNVLDTSELSVFMKKALKAGCSQGEINSVINQVGVSGKDSETKETVTEMNDIFALRRTIAARKGELAKRESNLSSLKEAKTKAAPKRDTKTGENVGFWSGGIAGAAFMAKFPAPPLGKVLLAAGGFLLGAGIGAATGMGIEAGINALMPDSHTEKVIGKEMNEYETSNIEPLKQNIKALEKQLAEKEDNFYE